MTHSAESDGHARSRAAGLCLALALGGAIAAAWWGIAWLVADGPLAELRYLLDFMAAIGIMGIAEALWTRWVH